MPDYDKVAAAVCTAGQLEATAGRGIIVEPCPGPRGCAMARHIAAALRKVAGGRDAN